MRDEKNHDIGKSIQKDGQRHLQSSLVYFNSCLFQVSFISSRASRVCGGEVHSVGMATEAVVGTPRDLK